MAGGFADNPLIASFRQNRAVEAERSLSLSAKAVLRQLALLIAFFLLTIGASHAQVTLNPPYPAEGQAGATLINVTGANFPLDAIGTVNVVLRPAAGGAETLAPATLVRLLGGTSRVAFLIPRSIIVTSPTPYLLSVSGSTTSGVLFLSVNAVGLTLNPASSVVLSPNAARAGTSLDVEIVGSFTNFVQGATVASFGPGISVENGALGASGFARVNGPNSATVHVGIDASAATGTRNIVINTGAQRATATFNVLPQELPPPDPVPPAANAGPQQLVPLGSTVHLDGSQSTSGAGGILSFEWSILSKPAGSTAGLSDPGAVNPWFVADKPGEYVAQLKVTEGTKSSAASVIITTSNTSPVANAGPPQSVALGSTVQLDGSASTDVDGDSLSYQWELVSKPAGSAAALANPAEVMPSFTADLAGDYVAQLTVNDGHNHTATASVTITTINAAPTARAGNPQTVTVGSLVHLDGSASSDPDADPLAFAWIFTSKPAGSAATLQGATTAAPSFTADVFGTYVLQLTVADGKGHTATANVSIDTSNSPPTANAGNPQTALVGSTVQLDGSNSSDPDHQPLTYTWSLVSRPSGSSAVLSSLTSAKPTLVVDVRGFYVAQLLVSDGTFTSAPSTVLITATSPEFVAEPTIIDFGDQAVGSTSPSREVQIQNPGNGTLTISQISLVGADPANFGLSSAALPLTLAPGKKTTVSVTFHPGVAASLSALLEFQDDAEGSPHRISLSGRGIAPVISYTPGSLDFGTRSVGAVSSAQVVTVSNSGTANLVLSELKFAGDHPGDFQIDSGALPITVAPGGNTSLQVKFAPTAIGQRNATLVLTTNAASSPHVLALTGNGSGADVLVQPAMLDFGDQIVATTPKTQSVLISNNGNADLVVSNLSISGPNSQYFGFSSQALPLTVTPGSSASINVAFDPQTSGPQAATLSIEDNSTNGPQVVTLAGTGLAPEISYSPGSITFPNQAVGTSSAPVAISVTNVGTSDLTISEIAFSGGSPGDFSSSTKLPIVVAPMQSATISVTFQPTAPGLRSASLVFSGNAAGSPHVVGLQGSGVASGVSLAPTALVFTDQALNQTSSPRQFSITNSGTALLTVSSLSLSGPCAAQFAISSAALPVSLAPGQSSNVGVTFTPVELAQCNATLNVVSNAPGSPHALPLSGNGIGTPGISVSPVSLNFGNQVLHVASAAKTLTVSNAGTEALIISAISLSGFHAADFSLNAPAVPITLAPGDSTTLTVTFTPGALGSRSATLNFTHNGTASPRSVPLSGTGTAPAVSLAPAALLFGNQEVGVASALKPLVINNVGTAALVISGLVLSPAAPQFEVSADTLPITVPPGGSTTVNLRFTPTATSTYSTALVITDNASGSPRAVPISGTGASALIGIVPSMLSFGSQAVGPSSAPMAVTISNPGTVDLAVSSIALEGDASADFSFIAPARPITLAPGASTVISVTFTPKASGSRLANLVLTDNAAGGPHSVTLSGTGSSTGTTVNLFPTSLTFGNQSLDTVSAAKFVAVSNTGGANLVISSLNITGAAAADFSYNVNLPMTIGPGGSASLPVIFKPSALGLRSATLTFVDNGAGGPRTVDLSGTGTGIPQFSVAPQSITFANQNVGTSSSPSSVVVTNTGTDNLVLSSLNVFGFGQAGDFAISAGALPITIAPGASTTINITFKPGAQGLRSSSLSIVDNAVGSPHTVALSGLGTAPQISVSPQSVIFGSQAVSSTSNPRVVMVANSGTGPMLISSVAISGSNAGDFAVSPGPLPITIQPGASIPVSLTFSPGATGSRSGTLTITHDAAGGSTTLALSGTGIVAGPALNLNPTSLGFGNQQVSTTSSALLLLLENPGTENLVISSLSITGANAAEFAVNAPSLPITVIPGGNALLHVAFTPASPGPRSASLNIVHNADGSPGSVSSVRYGSCSDYRHHARGGVLPDSDRQYPEQSGLRHHQQLRHRTAEYLRLLRHRD